MTYIVKVRTLPGSPMLCEYECAVCGDVFEQIVKRDENGDPPPSVECADVPCYGIALLCLSAPLFGNACWVRPIGRASRGDEKDPRALNTEPLATGKMTRPEWDKYQRGITTERRYQKRIKSGRISKRVQVGGG